MEELGAPSMYEITKFIYLFNNPEDDINNNSITSNNSVIHGPFNEQDVQRS